jgi:hypothetical protein
VDDKKRAALDAVSKVKELAWGLASTAALLSAVELGLAEAVGEQPAAIADLAIRVNADPDALDRLLYMLACRGVFARQVDGRYAHTALSRLLREDDPNSVSYLVRWIGAPCLWQVWPRLPDAVRTGKKVFPEVFGKELFDYLHEDAWATGRVLNRAMTQASNHTSESIVDVLELAGVATVADIGGGQGHLLREVLRRNPELRGVLFDLPAVVQGAVPELHDGGTLADRCEVRSGDCRQAVPVAADLYLLKNILEWHDADTVATLRNVVGSARPGARVVVIETRVDRTPEPLVTTALDLLLLANVTGKKHTAEHVAGLFERSGLRPAGVVDTGTFLSLTVGMVPEARA